MLLKTSFSLPHLFCNVQFEFSLFHNTQQSLEILIFKIEMLLEFQNKTDIDIIGFKLMHFGFPLVLSDIDLGNIDLLDTDIPSKPVVSLQDALKTSSRHVFKTSSRHVFKTSSRHVSRRLQICLQEGLKTSSRPTDLINMSIKGYQQFQYQTVFHNYFLCCNCLHRYSFQYCY